METLDDKFKAMVKRGRGRPPAEVNLNDAVYWAAKGMKNEDIAAKLKICIATFYRRDDILEAVAAGRAERMDPILDVNYKKALSGDDKAIDREYRAAGYLQPESTNILIQQNNNNERDEVKEKSTDELLRELEQ